MALDLLAVQFVKVKYELTRYWCDHHDHQDHHDRHDHHDNGNNDDHGNRDDRGDLSNLEVIYYNMKLEVVHKEIGDCT